MRTSLLLFLILAAAPHPARAQDDAAPRRFELTWSVTVPAADAPTRIWLPIPPQLPEQEVSEPTWTLDGAPAGDEVTVHSGAAGNRYGFLTLAPSSEPRRLSLNLSLLRRPVRERSGPAVKDPESWLRPDSLVPVNDEARRRAEAAAGESEGAARLRRLFEATREQMTYDKSGEGWGRGSFEHACDVGKGNCTDFHAYVIGLCRALSIPARFEVGHSVPKADSGRLKGYHCWAFAAEDGRWWPMDISEADKHPERADAYFGRLDADRFTVTIGRDLILSPAPSRGPINFLTGPYAERGEDVIELEVELTYKEASARSS